MLELLKEFVGRLMPNDRKVGALESLKLVQFNLIENWKNANNCFFKEVLAFLGTKARSLEGGKEEQAIFDSYVVALKGLGKKDKRRPQPN